MRGKAGAMLPAGRTRHAKLLTGAGDESCRAGRPPGCDKPINLRRPLGHHPRRGQAIGGIATGMPEAFAQWHVGSKADERGRECFFIPRWNDQPCSIMLDAAPKLS